MVLVRCAPNRLYWSMLTLALIKEQLHLVCKISMCLPWLFQYALVLCSVLVLILLALADRLASIGYCCFMGCSRVYWIGCRKKQILNKSRLTFL
jgi:hypothetical protein